MKPKLLKKIFLLTAIPVVFAVILISLFFVSSLSSEVKAIKNDAIFSSVQSHGQQITNLIESYRLYLKGLSLELNGKTSEQITNKIINYDFKNKNIEYLFYINSRKEIFYSHHTAPLICSEKDYQKIKTANTDLLLSNAARSHFSNNMLISVFLKLENNDYLGLAIKLEVLQNIISSIKFGANSFAFMTDSDGLITAIPLKHLILKLNVHRGDETLGYSGMNKIAQNFYANYQPTTGIYIRAKTNESFRSFMIPIQGTNGWAMGFVYPVENYFAEIKRINIQFLFLMSLLTIMMMGILTLALYSSLRPIKQMIKIFTNLANKSDNSADLTARVRVTNRDEIGELGVKFNNFMHITSDLVAYIKQADKELQINISESNLNLNNISENLEEQISEINLLARGMDEFSGTIQEIAKSSNQSSQAIAITKQEIKQNSVLLQELESILQTKSNHKIDESDAQDVAIKIKIMQENLATSLQLIDNLENSNIQIAASTEQQSQTSLVINQNLTKVLSFSGQIVDSTKKISKIQISTRQAAQDLEILIARFKINS